MPGSTRANRRPAVVLLAGLLCLVQGCGVQPGAPSAGGFSGPSGAEPAPPTPRLTLGFVGPARSSVAVGERIAFAIRVAHPSVVHCYHEYLAHGRRRVARVFPNRYQPRAAIGAGHTVLLPGSAARFDLVPLEGATTERLTCVATAGGPVVALPEIARARDLTPLPRLTSAESAAFRHFALDPQRTEVRTLSWTVPGHP